VASLVSSGCALITVMTVTTAGLLAATIGANDAFGTVKPITDEAAAAAKA
jgi:hypothetical protein